MHRRRDRRDRQRVVRYKDRGTQRTRSFRTMDAAVDARLLRDNPCRGVKAPRGASRREPRFLTPAEVEQLAAALRAPYDLLVRFAAYTGLRWGEIGALHVADVDLLRRSVRVGRSLERDGSFKDTKTHTRRTGGRIQAGATSSPATGWAANGRARHRAIERARQQRLLLAASRMAS